MDLFKSILLHEGFMAFYGVIIWYVILYGIDKKKALAAHKKITFGKWFKVYNTDVLIVVLIAFAMVVFDDELVTAYNDFFNAEFVFEKYMYLFPGLFTDMIIKAYTKFIVK